jgi:hypothetical protein
MKESAAESYVYAKSEVDFRFGNDVGVDTKCGVDAGFGNDVVDTKSPVNGTFGKDVSPVDIKRRGNATFDNYSIGFVRVRKRALKGGHPSSIYWRRKAGLVATEACSFDLVRAVRINGKPRHQFILGLGSQKNVSQDYELVHFWMDAVRRMTRHGLAEHQRRRLVGQMVRKGAKFPPPDLCSGCAEVVGYIGEFARDAT